LTEPDAKTDAERNAQNEQDDESDDPPEKRDREAEYLFSFLRQGCLILPIFIWFLDVAVVWRLPWHRLWR
jgi:hypothetical protein